MTDDTPQADAAEVRRDRIIWTTLIILGVIVAAGTIALSWRLIEGRLGAAKELDQAVALLKGSDATVTAADEVVRAAVSTQSAAKAAAVAPLITATIAQLVEANRLAGNGFDRLTDDEQKKVRLVQAASTARAEMLKKVPAIISARSQAAQADEAAAQGWTRALAADKLALKSVASYNKLKRADMKAAAVTNAKAKAAFTEAADLLERADLAFPDARLGVFSVYIDGRLKLLAVSKKAGDAWLAGNIAEANSLRLEYNKTDEVAVQRAKQLPGTPQAAIADAYKSLVDAPVREYYKAREKAAEADKALRTL